MLTKILIANRGEVAIRVMRSCRELGIATVAVYSDLDRRAAHVRYADEAYAIGGAAAIESYLNADAILDVLERSGADGLHPGYGFFAENADFARMVAGAGITWVGPPPGAIEVMGDKLSSRKAAAAAGVASIPGTAEPVTGPDEVIAFGEANGWPVAIKAVYGGGGKGLKVVGAPAEVGAALDSVAREATAYFGRPEAYLERYLVRPRHIEVQIMCDAHGHAVWLGERDCSIQRRHQKLIEESPAPLLDDSMRTAMGEAALDVARSCGYVNAGTVEMLVEDGRFWFLEMNTRLQVEHCVTEMVTGIDLVAEQIRVASGEPLSFTQGDVTPHGHAIECRINAEDPARGFLPSPGPITRLRIPSGPGVRWDGGYEEGDTLSQFYDNLIGKLVVWGRDREQARVRALRALAEIDIEGVHTTVPAHQAVLAHPDYIAGGISTRWVEQELDVAGLGAAEGVVALEVGAGGVERTIPVEVDGRRFTVRVWLPDLDAGTGAAPSSARRPARPRPRSASSASTGESTIRAPMQGTIVQLLVAEGDTVVIGQAVLVLEAMKMENHVHAERDGTVLEVRVAVGDTVGTGDVLVVIE